MTCLPPVHCQSRRQGHDRERPRSRQNLQWFASEDLPEIRQLGRGGQARRGVEEGGHRQASDARERELGAAEHG